MDKLKRLLKKTPPVPLGIAGALLFLLLFYRPISITTK